MNREQRGALERDTLMRADKARAELESSLEEVKRVMELDPGVAAKMEADLRAMGFDVTVEIVEARTVEVDVEVGFGQSPSKSPPRRDASAGGAS